MRRGWDGAIIGEGLVSVADEENVFGLKVGVDEIEVVKDCACQLNIPSDRHMAQSTHRLRW